jgi:hypothetical protein
MQNHFIKQYFARIVHTHGDHCKAVANKNNFHTSMIGDMGTWEVMGSHDGDWFVLAVKTLDGIDGNRFSIEGGTHRRV